ncbi:M-phase phosphoprotein 6-like [Plakobranchus ocellatus]|uniref:M-phase phosphoprotein 6-like n=1 Tax=Plakobranchus ocellatus TaxID=259542 RepID=A0AAV4DH61_9GAST|nr:M-phase phosphoprotein 6-like [Plakobranchus ocellatus]
MATKQGAQLSKNVLQMKFMQRSVLRMEKEQNEEERQKIIDDEHWALDLPEYKTKESDFLVNQSYSICEELQFGRQSFQGFNPEVEKLMKVQNAEKEAEKTEQKEKEESVGDIEMAKRYSSLMGIIAKKFAKKRQHSALAEDDEGPSKKRAFLKPSDS